MTENAHYAEIVHRLPSAYPVYSVYPVSLVLNQIDQTTKWTKSTKQTRWTLSESAQCGRGCPRSESGRKINADADFHQKRCTAHLLHRAPSCSHICKGFENAMTKEGR